MYDRVFESVRIIKVHNRDGTSHVFKHGVGPCGRTVSQLQILRDDTSWIVRQVCRESERADHFFYNRDDVIRVAVYQTDNPNPAKEQNK